MAVELKCNVCGCFLKAISLRELKQMDVLSINEQCKDCTRRFEQLDKAIEVMKKKAERSFHQTLTQAKEELAALIEELAKNEAA